MNQPDPNILIPSRASRGYLKLKRVFDVVFALVTIVIIAPLLLAVAFWIRLDSRGPALFRQTRVGFRGKPFTILKFRTMRTDVDPFGDSPASGTDPRITWLGRMLRETSIDELPQLFNILAGDMSFVGPRPLYMQQAETWTARQRSRLQVKPGLTGYSQIHGRASISMEEKLEWDVKYVQDIGLRTDLWILWRTCFSVLHKRGLYEKKP